jgi:hypothetical protein
LRYANEEEVGYSNHTSGTISLCGNGKSEWQISRLKGNGRKLRRRCKAVKPEKAANYCRKCNVCVATKQARRLRSSHSRLPAVKGMVAISLSVSGMPARQFDFPFPFLSFESLCLAGQPIGLPRTPFNAWQFCNINAYFQCHGRIFYPPLPV